MSLHPGPLPCSVAARGWGADPESTWRCLLGGQNLRGPGSPRGLAPGQVLRGRLSQSSVGLGRRSHGSFQPRVEGGGRSDLAVPARSRCWECRGCRGGREVQRDRPQALRTRAVGGSRRTVSVSLRSDTSGFHEAPGLWCCTVTAWTWPNSAELVGPLAGHVGAPIPVTVRAVPRGGTVFPQNCRPRTRAGLSTPEGWVQ